MNLSKLLLEEERGIPGMERKGVKSAEIASTTSELENDRISKQDCKTMGRVALPLLQIKQMDSLDLWENNWGKSQGEKTYLKQ